MKNIKLVIGELYKADKKTVIGYRLVSLNTENDTTDVKDVPTSGLVQAIAGGMVFSNVALVSGKIVGTQGSIERIPKIVYGGQVFQNNSMTIAYRIADAGYRMVDWTGKSAKVRTEDAIKLVDTCKFDDIANGKIVEHDGLKFISAINGDYETVNIARKPVVKIRSTDVFDTKAEQNIYKSSTSMQNKVVKEEIAFNDVFNVLTPEQRTAIEMYYTWWTTTTFNSLSQGGRVELQSNPKKVAALAQLRGKDIKWAYGGSKIARLYSPSGFDYCTLGHKLQIVHFAKGVDTQGKTYSIKFGSTCSADFFNIKPEAMNKLIKVTNTMKEEIDQLVKWAEAKELELHAKYNYTLTCIINSLGSNNADRVKAFQEYVPGKLGEFIIMFNSLGLPFPASMTKAVREGLIKWSGVIGDDDIRTEFRASIKIWIDFLRKSPVKVINDRMIEELNNGYYTGIFRKFATAMELAFVPGIEGENGWDPLRKIGDRGRGRFTIDAATGRKRALASMRRLGVKDKGKNDFIPAYNEMQMISGLILEYNKRYTELDTILHQSALEIKNYAGGNTESQSEFNSLRDTFATRCADYLNELGTAQEQRELALYCLAFDAFRTNTKYYFYGLKDQLFPYSLIEENVIYGIYDLERIHSLSNKTLRTFIDKLVAERKKQLDKSKNAEKEFLDALKRNKEEADRKAKENSDVIDAQLKAHEEKRKAEIKLKEAQRREREAIVCTHDECKHNDGEGACKLILEHGIRPEQAVNDEGLIVKCNVSQEEPKEQLSLAGEYKLYRAQAGDKVENTYKKIADSIVEREGTELSWKQENVLKKAIEVYKKALYGGNSSKVSDERTSDENTDTDNWTKELKDEPTIMKEITDILDLASSGDKRIPKLTINIARSCKRYGKVSAKQYKHIDETARELGLK